MYIIFDMYSLMSNIRKITLDKSIEKSSKSPARFWILHNREIKESSLGCLHSKTEIIAVSVVIVEL